MVLHAGMKFGLSAPDRALLQSYLCPCIANNNDEASGGDISSNNGGGGGGGGGGNGSAHGWEEVVDAAVTHLLKTSLSKNSKDSASLAVGAIEVGSTVCDGYMVAM